MRSEAEVPVVIIGGGPVGLSVALDLGLRGVASTLIERDLSTGEVLLAKAGTLNERTMEICRQWGILEDVKELYPDDKNLDTVYCTGLDGFLIGRDPRPPAKDRPLPPGAREVFRKAPQFRFDPLLANACKATGMSRLLYGHRFERLEQDDDGVTAFLTNLADGASSEIRARYLVAADGAHSSVRKQLDVGFPGKLLSYSMSAMIRAPSLANTKFGESGRYMFIDENGTWANITWVDGYDLWRFTLIGDEEKLDPSRYDVSKDIDRAFGGLHPYTIERLMPWRRSQMLIDSYRVGRVLFAGDAAHTTSPTGGHGLNTGIGDALALGWMIAAIEGGYGAPGLLDAYHLERRPVADRNINISTQNFGIWTDGSDFSKVCEEGADAEKARALVGETLSKSLKQEWVSYGVALGYRYEGSPIIESDGSPPTPDEVSSYTQTARPGHRAPHAWLGDDKSTTDLFGKGFVLLRFGGGDVESLVEAARGLGAPFEVVDIADARIAALYERRLVLVRPDGHVAWRDDAPPDDPVVLLRKLFGHFVEGSEKVLPPVVRDLEAR